MRRHVTGLTLVELLVGLTVGLLIAGEAAAWIAASLREQRASLLEGRLLQDLRTAADVVVRDLRRAGYWGAASEGVWLPGVSTAAVNPYAAITPVAAASDAIAFAYSRDVVENDALDANEQFGFRLRGGAIQMQLGGGWQAVTDVETLVVTAFELVPDVQSVSLGGICPTACAASSTTCPPQVQVRSLGLHIEGRAAHDPAVVRSVRARVRLRNDALVGSCS